MIKLTLDDCIKSLETDPYYLLYGAIVSKLIINFLKDNYPLIYNKYRYRIVKESYKDLLKDLKELKND
jgi:hypothetical protein